MVWQLFVTPQRGLARWEGGDGGSHAAVRDAFTIEHYRQFDHDPRFGPVVLSEIASRAISPGVNDTGNAIAVLGSGVRAMEAFLDVRGETKPTTMSPDGCVCRTFCFPIFSRI